MPKNIVQDKEQLYDDIISLKKKLNNCAEENIRLKTQLQISDTELAKKDTYIKELLGRVNMSHMHEEKVHKIKVDTHLVTALKKRVKELSTLNTSKSSEIQTIRRSVKLTKLYEAEVEIKAYQDECQRLREVIDEVQNKCSGTSELPVGQPTAAQNSSVAKKLREENDELLSAIHKKEEELTGWKEKAKKVEKRVQMLEKEAEKKEDDNEEMIRKLTVELEKRKEEAKGEVNQLKKANIELKKAVKMKEEELEEKLDEVAKHAEKKYAYETELKLLREKVKECMRAEVYGYR